MLPKEILNLADKQQLLDNWPSDPLADPSDEQINVLLNWLFSAQTLAQPAVQRYIFYLKSLYQTFQAIAEFFPKQNPGREGEVDDGTVATSPEEMLYLANHIYVLDSYDIKGAILEGGCFKGYSSCCLSQACAFLGRQLIIADSFEGLPPNFLGDKNLAGYTYQAGDFEGSIEEVQANIRRFGRPEVVEYVKGFFSESLKGWSKPLAMLWLDVDLYQSAHDAISNVFDSLEPTATILSHEMRSHRIKNNKFTVEHGPAGAYHHFFKTRNIDYRAKYVLGCTGLIALASSQVTISPKLITGFLAYWNGKEQLSDHNDLANREIEQLKAQLVEKDFAIQELSEELHTKEVKIQSLLSGRVMRLMLGVQSRTNYLLRKH